MFSFYSSNLFAQDTQVSEQTWLNYKKTISLSKKSSLDLVGVLEFEFPVNSWNRISFRPDYSYKLSELIALDGMLGILYTGGNEENVTELRLSEGIKIFFPIFQKLVFTNYIRIEQRFKWEDDEYEFQPRFRYKLSTSLFAQNKFYIPLSLEFFFKENSLKEAFAAQNRFSAGIGYNGNDYKMELNYYIKQSKNNNGDEIKTSTHVIELKFGH